MKKIRLLILTFLAISLLFLVTGCSLLPDTSLGILQYSLEKRVVEGELTAQIVGVAQNDGSARLEYAEIIGDFYNQGDTLLATGFARTISEQGESFTLAPGEIWEFTISCSSSARDVHPSLNILSWDLEIDNLAARIVGEAENNGDVVLSFAEITGTFYDAAEEELASGTVTTTRLGIGEIWEYTIFYPAPNFVDVDQVKVEVTNTDYEPEPTQNVDHATVEVGALRGSTIMP
ncbi:unnamed protein product [marine sediment metagenome]|uniref:Uncharacterized protein n=1 Tax=marine sediment metagenome TaxID=412755 RepID=X1K892_9ZZZZ